MNTDNWKPEIEKAKPARPNDAAIKRWAELGAHGVLVSVAYGPTLRNQGGLGWTVIALHPKTNLQFEKPFEARDLPHAIEIAEREATKRGWLKL